jgi:hypothetical protein
MGGVRGPARRLERHGAEGTTRGCFRKFWWARDRPPGATRRPSGTLSMRLLLQRHSSLLLRLDRRSNFDLDFGSRHTDAVAGDIVMRWRTKDLSRPDVELRTVQTADDLVASDLSLGQRPGVMCASAKKFTIAVDRGNPVFPSHRSAELGRARSRPSSPLSQSHPWILPLVCFGTTPEAMNIVNATSAPCLCGCVGPRASPVGDCGATHCGACHASLRQVTFCFASCRPALAERD